MKRKGFTLIELLAVILVLAMIALIAIPTVSTVRKNARISSIELSATNYIKAVDLLMSTMELSGTLVADGVYEISKDGNLSFGTVEFSGTKPDGGSIVVKNGEVVKRVSAIEIEDYTVTYKDGVGKAQQLVELSEVCSLVSGAANTVGSKYSCDLGDGARNFYVLEVGNNPIPNSTLISNEIALIYENNYDATQQSWCNQSGPHPNDATLCQADGLTAKLDEIAEAWSKLDRSQVTLPSAEQVLLASVPNYDLEQLTITTKTAHYLNNADEWLYKLWDRPRPSYPLYGYWTSSADVDPNYAWHVYANLPKLMRTRVSQTQVNGVRPVITLPF